jgi:DnaJ domain
LPKYLRTNISPAALQLSDATLYFFPDRLFIWHSGRFAALDYREIKLRSRRITFLEREKQPPDAAVESQMRLSPLGNKTIPVNYYGLVEVSASGLAARLMTSRVESAEEFVSKMRSVTGGGEQAGEADEKEPLYTHFDTRVPLFYNLDELGLRRLQAVREAFSIIQRCDCVWRYEGEERTDDWKRNAGAGTLVTRSRLYPALVDQSAGFDSNVAFGFSFGHSTLFLLPDGFVLGIGERYRSLGKSLDVNASTTNFREEEFSPRDAHVIGRTWRYVNKSGGPDRRFNDNRQIPIHRYGQLEIGCGAWRIRLCLSRANAAAEFATSLRSALSGQKSDAANAHTEVPPAKPARAADLSAAFALLGLKASASLEDASTAYKTLAAQSHPDKVAQMASEFRELAERKMRELNAAYEQIQESYKHR